MPFNCSVAGPSLVTANAIDRAVDSDIRARSSVPVPMLVSVTVASFFGVVVPTGSQFNPTMT